MDEGRSNIYIQLPGPGTLFPATRGLNNFILMTAIFHHSWYDMIWIGISVVSVIYAALQRCLDLQSERA